MAGNTKSVGIARYVLMDDDGKECRIHASDMSRVRVQQTLNVMINVGEFRVHLCGNLMMTTIELDILGYRRHSFRIFCQ